MGNYKKLDVWQYSCDLAGRVEDFVSRLPHSVQVKYGDQLCRAVNSIHENIAEGCGLNSDKQLAKFLRQALGSANETEDELLAMKRRGFLKDADLSMLEEIRRICAMLAVFIRRVDPDLRGG
jgi:four helix bundle protein